MKNNFHLNTCPLSPICLPKGSVIPRNKILEYKICVIAYPTSLPNPLGKVPIEHKFYPSTIHFCQNENRR